jgi:hypothetical protein
MPLQVLAEFCHDAISGSRQQASVPCVALCMRSRQHKSVISMIVAHIIELEASNETAVGMLHVWLLRYSSDGSVLLS